MRSINIREAREKLGDLVDAAEHGEPILITRRGKAVARLEPVGSPPTGPLPDLSEFRASIKAATPGDDEPISGTTIKARKQARY